MSILRVEADRVVVAVPVAGSSNCAALDVSAGCTARRHLPHPRSACAQDPARCAWKIRIRLEIRIRSRRVCQCSVGYLRILKFLEGERLWLIAGLLWAVRHGMLPLEIGFLESLFDHISSFATATKRGPSAKPSKRFCHESGLDACAIHEALRFGAVSK
jgi:hypothetical protein